MPKHLLEGAVFNARYLKKLRQTLMEELLRDVNRGTELYLRDVSEIPEDERREKSVSTYYLLAKYCFSQSVGLR